MIDRTLDGKGGNVTDCHYSGTVHRNCFEPFGKNLMKADLVATDHFRHCFLWSCLSLSLFNMAGSTSGWVGGNVSRSLFPAATECVFIDQFVFSMVSVPLQRPVPPG